MDVSDEETMYKEIHEMLANSPVEDAEEWAIHDYEYFGSLRISENEGVERVVALAEFINEHGDLGAEVLAYYGGDIEDAQDALENYYHGAHESELDSATNLFDDCYAHEVPDHLLGYIDYEKFARDLFISDYFTMEVNGETHVFSYH